MLHSLILAASLCGAADLDRPTVIVVVGAEGTAEYGQQFRKRAERWRSAAEAGQAEFIAIGLDSQQEDAPSQKAAQPAAAQQPPANTDRDLLELRLAERAESSTAPLWLVLIGHGTFDGQTARFNLRGPDLSAAELARWLAPATRPLAVINCASASAPFLKSLAGENRVVLTATKSGYEYNFSRFGDYLSAAIANPRADLDKDDQTSLLEAFLMASADVEEFYRSEARLPTEHALLDDNGDGLGTPADWFQGVRAVKRAKDGALPDGGRAGRLVLAASAREQRLPPAARARRDELEQAIERLRERKAELAEDAYFEQLEPLATELARLYQQAEQL
jgi:hypothetical protein